MITVGGIPMIDDQWTEGEARLIGGLRERKVRVRS